MLSDQCRPKDSILGHHFEGETNMFFFVEDRKYSLSLVNEQGTETRCIRTEKFLCIDSDENTVQLQKVESDELAQSSCA